MKKLLAVVLLIITLGIISGCKSMTERSVRRRNQRNHVIARNLEALPRDIEVFWLTDEPLHLNRYEGP